MEKDGVNSAVGKEEEESGLCRNRRGRETAAAASGTGGVGRQPLLNAVHVEAMVTPSQHTNPLSLHELRQANRTLCFRSSQLHPCRKHQART
nr:hypothetical protein CFP56_73418 [Quercus suber]